MKSPVLWFPFSSLLLKSPTNYLHGPNEWLLLHLFDFKNLLSLFGYCLLYFSCEVAQSCPTLCDPMDCSLPGSSVHGIFQARVLEWVAISFSRGSPRPRDCTQVSRIAGRRFAIWATRVAHFSYLSIKLIFFNFRNISSPIFFSF